MLDRAKRNALRKPRREERRRRSVAAVRPLRRPFTRACLADSRGATVSLNALARLLGIKPDHAEDALHSERAARAVLTRRNLFAAGGALAAGSVFSFGRPIATIHPFMLALADAVADTNVNAWKQLAWINQVPFHIAAGEPEEAFRDRMRQTLREQVTAVILAGRA